MIILCIFSPSFDFPGPCLRAPMEVSKTTVIYVKFLHDVACQKLLTLANMFHGVIQKIKLAQFFLRHGVYQANHVIKHTEIFFSGDFTFLASCMAEWQGPR